MSFLSIKKYSGHPDYFLLSAFIVLVVFGLAALSSASSDLGKIKFGDTYYYLKHQVLAGLLYGIAGFIVCYFIPYKHYKKFAIPLLVLTLIGLGAVLFTPYGFSSGGSQRWLQIGQFSFQPSEILKMTFIIYLAAWLSSRYGANRQNNLSDGFAPFLFLSTLVGILLVLQPATSAVVIILASGLIIYFMSGAKIIYIIASVALAGAALVALIYITPYRFERLAGFLGSAKGDTQGSSYHLDQALITLGAGGLTGVGYGRSTNKYRYLPESIGDSIFAVIGEEFGFVGAAGLISVFFVLVLRGMLIARKVRDGFGKLLMIGFSALIGIQAFINMAAISGLIPITGVTLPFISYGGTSLAVFMTMAGVMVNVSKYATS